MICKNILIVEDDKPIREMIKTLLEIEGYQVIAAANGLDGINAMKKMAPPCLIILDMMMPVMNGWDFLDMVRANPETARIPIVVVSAYNEIARSVRPNAVVPKPVHLDSLLKAIEECAA